MLPNFRASGHWRALTAPEPGLSEGRTASRPQVIPGRVATIL
jgi:hypothetical protein